MTSSLELDSEFSISNSSAAIRALIETRFAFAALSLAFGNSTGSMSTSSEEDVGGFSFVLAGSFLTEISLNSAIASKASSSICPSLYLWGSW